ncbi:MAG TPA: type III pantothenate kinase, partial [Pirellulales bacterium]
MPIIATDIGNSRIKLGLFAAHTGQTGMEKTGLPLPDMVLSLPAEQWDETALQRWLGEIPPGAPWWIGSVNRPAAARLTEWIGSKWPIRNLAAADLPIMAAVDRPEHVGIDRLAGALAANRLRDPARPAVVVHVGSAITVNLITADGIFRGGAILPGLETSARALHDYTDMLPHAPLEDLATAPPSIGTSTLTAIYSGLYWGAVGAIRELIGQLTATLGSSAAEVEVFLTGGAAPAVADQLDPAVRYVEHLVLAGIALAKP